MDWKFKLLAGELAGAEYALVDGDTVFVSGPRKDLISGHVAHTLADADNLYFIPGAESQGRFVIRCGVDGVLLGVADDDGLLQFEPIATQRAHRAGNLWFAVRCALESWSRDVLDFEPPRTLPAVVSATDLPETARSRRKPLAFGMLALALGVVGVVAWMRGAEPEAQVTSLESELRNGPVDYAVAYGRDQRLHVFTDSAEGVAWGLRAVERLGKPDAAVFLERDQEEARLGRKLSEAGLEYVVIRLDDPARPAVVMSIADGSAPVDARRIREVLLPDMPYAEALDITSVSDRHLAEMVRDDLRARGIPAQVHAGAGRVSVSNDIALDDAALHAMAAYRNAFVAQWGDRRLSINIQLWDDLLKGASFHYTPAKLLSMGGGVWNITPATQDGPAGQEDFP